MPHPKARTVLARITLLTLLVAPFATIAASAYTIYLKDGSKIVAEKEYRLEGDKAYITLPSGTQTFLDADQIDVERTREVNSKDYGTAVVIEDGQRRTRESGERAAPPPRETRLSDLISERGSGTRLPETKAPAPGATKGASPTPRGRTASGTANLSVLDRAVLADAELASEISNMMASQRLEAVNVYRGTSPRRPFLEVVASSEAAVFRAITGSARALTQLRERHGDEIEGLELLILTSSRDRAGQFFISADAAQSLQNGEVEVPEFFVQNVQF